ncbi:protein fuzzy homolog isoform X6 [Lepisosteus oculatus]|uniref:protein fuzzy homolog isoform X6 n=1 Tax=Lepisosteus oculatus TaxID=7918 RepID=UPI00371DE241
MLQGGSVQLLCLTASSGVPLFCRGATRPLPFSIIGSLNGVHMFGGGQGTVLSSCVTDRGGRVLWRVFHDTVVLIAVSSQESGAVSELRLRRLLENSWNAMVLVLGLDELASARNVERLKRDLRSCYRLIDAFLEGEWDGMGDLMHCADCVVPLQPALLQEVLDSFAHAADSEFGCLLTHGKIIVATEKWWRLAPQEVVLLSALVRTLDGTISRDYPVFLPQGSPTVPHRLLCFQLLPGLDVCVLCGPSPSLQKAESELVVQFWSPVIDTLHGCLALRDRCLPSSVTLQHGILGLLLINRESRRAVSTVHLWAGAPADVPLPARRRELLRALYTLAITRYFLAEDAQEEHRSVDGLEEDFPAGFSHQPVQFYLATDECKCFALQTPQHQLYLLTSVTVPTFALRSLATRTLSTLLSHTGF